MKNKISKKSLVQRAKLADGVEQLKSGALRVSTGNYTGRCPDAKFFVSNHSSKSYELIDWVSNQSVSQDYFLEIKQKIVEYLKDKQPIVQKLRAGCDTRYSLSLNVINELPWQALFANNMFVASDSSESLQEWTLYCAPGAQKAPKVLVNLETQEILITGTYYAGEIKKSVFTVLNYLLPQKNILPMHCSVNTSDDGDKAAVFFGLSGTGKTTLSADEYRVLIGDDEHGWSDSGIYNFEGGCYAKVINLSKEEEPQIWNACQQEGAILENVVINDGHPDFSNSQITENTRASYDISLIKGASSSGMCGHPDNVIFLTCDAFGVLPPVSKLSREQAVQHFMMGYTAKIAGTEAGIIEPQATFSHCFGAPFMPLRAREYADLLDRKVLKHNADCWLVNTGWSGGGYDKGKRMPIEVSRQIVNMIVDGMLADMRFRVHEKTGLTIPCTVGGEVDKYLVPELCWESLDEYNDVCDSLMNLFEEKISELSG